MATKRDANLAHLYELEQYASLVEFVTGIRTSIGEMLMAVDLTSLYSDKQVAFLQGQAFALNSFLKKMEDIHKKASKD